MVGRVHFLGSLVSKAAMLIQLDYDPEVGFYLWDPKECLQARQAV